jgi:hypothetical protein
VAFQPSITDMEACQAAANELLGKHAVLEEHDFQDLMEKSFPLQRNDILKWLQNFQTVETLLIDWPLLGSNKGVLEHFKLLTGFHIIDRMKEHLEEVARETVDYFLEK